MFRDVVWIVGVGILTLVVAAFGNALTSNADLRDAVTLGVLALGLLAASVDRRGYGTFVAALAFAGLSVAKYAVVSGEDSGGAVLLGPGAGLIVGYLIGVIVFGPRHWWPLVPGGIMTLLGGLLVFGGDDGALLAGRLWPIVLLGIGVLIWAAVTAGRRPHAVTG